MNPVRGSAAAGAGSVRVVDRGGRGGGIGASRVPRGLDWRRARRSDWGPVFDGIGAIETLVRPPECPFRQRLEPFSVIRFMDWQRTNNSKLVKWSQRARPDDARYTTAAGVPVVGGGFW